MHKKHKKTSVEVKRKEKMLAVTRFGDSSTDDLRFSKSVSEQGGIAVKSEDRTKYGQRRRKVSADENSQSSAEIESRRHFASKEAQFERSCVSDSNVNQEVSDCLFYLYFCTSGTE